MEGRPSIPCLLCECEEMCANSKKCARFFYPQSFDLLKDVNGLKPTDAQIAPGVKVSEVMQMVELRDDRPAFVTVEMVEIPMAELPQYIALAYEDDKMMQKSIHILGEKATFSEQVDYTYQQSIESVGDFPHRFYKIVLHEEGGDTAIGYTTLVFAEINLLHTFGININFRKDNIKKLWLSEIERLFGYDMYFITLRESNARAIGFFKKHNFTVELRDDEAGKFYLLWQQPS